jgi:hypothetical protein
LNTPLRKDTIAERDLIFVTEPMWKYFLQRYKGEELKRYAITTSSVGYLDRSPVLPIILFTIVIREEEIRTPKYLVLPRRSKISDIKSQLKETFQWLKDYPNEELHLWRLQPDQQDQEFIDQYN